jgi:hypothetical protein
VKSHSGGAFVLAAVLALSALAVALAGPALAANGPPGNNGTIKIHEFGTPSGTESNDPKVCLFNVEGYGFDVGQRGYLMFTVQGGDAPTGQDEGPYNFGPTQASAQHRSYYETEYIELADGHYKATLYGKFGDQVNFRDVKAKSKVFKVECEEAPQQPTTPPPGQPTTPPPGQPTTPPPGATTPPPGQPTTPPPGATTPPPGATTPPPGATTPPPGAGATPTPTPAGAVGGETGTPVATLPPTDTLEPSAQPGGNLPVVLLVLLAIGSIVAGATVLRPRPIRTRR